MKPTTTTEYVRLEIAHAEAAARVVDIETKLAALGRQLAENDPAFCPTCGSRVHRVARFDGPPGAAARERRTCKAKHVWMVTVPPPAKGAQP